MLLNKMIRHRWWSRFFVFAVSLAGVGTFVFATPTASGEQTSSETVPVITGEGFEGNKDVSVVTSCWISGSVSTPTHGTKVAGSASASDRLDWTGTIADATVPFWRVELTGKVRAFVSVDNYYHNSNSGYRTYAYCKLQRECASLPPSERLTGGSRSVLTYADGTHEDSASKNCYVELKDAPGQTAPENLEAKGTFEIGGTELSFWYEVVTSGDAWITRSDNVAVNSDANVQTAIDGQVIAWNGTSRITDDPSVYPFILK